MKPIFVLASLLTAAAVSAGEGVGNQQTSARATDGTYISWREHLIDSPETAGFNLSGSDGLVVGDLDNDGFIDIVSVHESDEEYDSAVADADFVPDNAGHVRIAFGSADPGKWMNITLAEGADAPAPEDAALADLNQDGYLDVVVAAELAHLIYLENPGETARTEPWQRLILPMTKGRGSYIRVFAGDLDGDGQPEVTAANKGAQRPARIDFMTSNPVSLFSFEGDPLDGANWKEMILGTYSIPQNAELIDLDRDGDLDVVIGSRGEQRIAWFENLGSPQFAEHAIGSVGGRTSGFNLAYADLNADKRLDIVAASTSTTELLWLSQPTDIDGTWVTRTIGTLAPDWVTGIELADIDGDGDMDVMTGSYSRGERQADGEVDVNDSLGRIAWFENPGKENEAWTRHDVSRRTRGMFDKFIAYDMDDDGDMDFISTRGNSAPYDGVFWLEQVRSSEPAQNFSPARRQESREMPLPEGS